MIKIIGDVHGKTGDYKRLVRNMPPGQRSIQVGDMGIGFHGVRLHQMSDDHKFFRGNHDNPAKCKASRHYLGDYGFIPQDNLFWIAGAFSIDRLWRTPMETWWPDEELSYPELADAISLYERVKPKYVSSHEAPQAAASILLAKLMGPYFTAKADCMMSRTAGALQTMLDLHQPKEWVFGHYHVNDRFFFRNTKFTCVPELGVYDLETDEAEISLDKS
jgi:hypothetical protein